MGPPDGQVRIELGGYKENKQAKTPEHQEAWALSQRDPGSNPASASSQPCRCAKLSFSHLVK